MEKDHLYKRATAFMNNGMIWLMKVLKQYMATKVLHYNYQDFLTALRDDLPPLFSNVGVWILETWINRLRELGDKDMIKRAKICLDIVKRVEEKGLEYFEAKESRYHLANKFSPKKNPDAHILRSSVRPLYSYKVYARPEYYQNL